jgi:hypothetical protein
MLRGAAISGTPASGGQTNVRLTASNGQTPDDSKMLVISVSFSGNGASSSQKEG